MQLGELGQRGNAGRRVFEVTTRRLDALDPFGDEVEVGFV